MVVHAIHHRIVLVPPNVFNLYYHYCSMVLCSIDYLNYVLLSYSFRCSPLYVDSSLTVYTNI